MDLFTNDCVLRFSIDTAVVSTCFERIALVVKTHRKNSRMIDTRAILVRRETIVAYFVLCLVVDTVNNQCLQIYVYIHTTYHQVYTSINIQKSKVNSVFFFFFYLIIYGPH